MRKINIIALLSSLALVSTTVLPVFAEDYSDTEAWYAKCSQAQTSQSGVKVCQGFQEYQKSKRESLKKDIDSYTNSITSLQNDTSKMEQLAKEQKGFRILNPCDSRN